MVDIVKIGDATLYCGDCRDVLPMLPTVDCVITDPPYFKVKGDYWDNEWDKPAEFLEWMRGILGLLAGRMKPNGSAYVFASPQMAGRVETVAWERLNVLGHIVWRKGRNLARAAGRGNGSDKDALRAFFPMTERVIFAEHHGFRFSQIRGYMIAELDACGLNPAQLRERLGYSSNVAHNWFSVSGSDGAINCWGLPTLADYRKLQGLTGRFQREYEDLRREYEDLRRPFSLTERDQWSDVWDFEPVAPYPGKHPCEKPISLLAHMLNASTKPGALVLDAFMGSGATGDACARTGRQFIGIERDREHFDNACRRLEQQHAQAGLFA